MKKHCIIICLCLSALSFNKGFSQDNSSEDFKPSGKPILQSFFDYGQGFGNQKDDTGFDIKRAIIGYNYKFTPSISAQVVIDGASGKSSTNKLEVYLRNAFVKWKQDNFDINFGLTGLPQFKTQEDYWGHRYVYKSFQDENSMGSSIDLGISGAYTFNSNITADLSFTNGSGYKKIEKSGSKKVGLGINLSPVKGWMIRVYGDVYNESEKMRGTLPDYISSYEFKNQYTMALFTGYTNSKFTLGAEFNKQFNKQFINNKNYYGYSAYGSLNLNPRWNVYARYDILDSNKPKDYLAKWNDNNGQLIIAGIEFKPNKYLKISPNFRNINLDNNKSKQYLFLNVEFKL